MSNVDYIIKYLSDEMTREEARIFEDELALKQDLKEEFDQVSAAYDLIRDQLQKRDEKEFKERLLKVLEHPASGKNHRDRSKQSRWYYYMALAASLSLILIIFLTPNREDKLFSRFYHPEDDKILLAYNQGTRGETESGILHYQLGNFQKTLEIMSDLFERDPENQLALLYYLLSSIEIGNPDQVLEKLAKLNLSSDHQSGQAIYWYTALALIKTDHPEEAAAYLQPLTKSQGPYQSDAKRLEKILLK